MNKRKIKVMIADDHTILRAGLRMLLSAQSDIAVVGEAENGDQAIQQVRVKKPDVALVDLTMPPSGGMETIRVIRSRFPRTRVIVLTMHEVSAYLSSALEAGASGYVLKRSLDHELLAAIRAVHRGGTFVDPRIADLLVKTAVPSRKDGHLLPHQAADLLSRRERQVLKLVAEGYTNQEISRQIFVGLKTVETYRSRVLKKLNLRGRREAVKFAIEAGLLNVTKRASRVDGLA